MGHSHSHLYMHQIVAERMGLRPERCDHWNQNRLDNRRKNIRAADGLTNQVNRRLSRNNTSGYKGVSRFADTGKWRAAIGYKRRQVHLGLFANRKAAARAYNKAALRYFGDFACLNKV